MASGDQYAFLSPRQFDCTNGSTAYPQLVKVGSCWGLPLNKLTNQYYVAEFRAGAGLATGLTVQTSIVDDDLANSDVGKAIVLGFSVKKIADNTDTYDITTGASAESTATITLDATAGETDVTSTNLTTIDSLAAGDRALLIIRRVGDSASDTHRGRPVLMGVTIRDT